MENILNIIDPLEDEFEDEVREERFKIKNLEEADWAFRKIKQAKEELQAKKDYTDAQKAKYDEYYEKEAKIAENSISFFESMLREYYEEQKLENPKFALKTALGTARTSTTKEWDYGNEEVLLNFLKENKLEEFVKITVKETINKVDLKKAVNVMDNGIVANAETGEVIEGIKVKENTKFVVKLT